MVRKCECIVYSLGAQVVRMGAKWSVTVCALYIVSVWGPKLSITLCTSYIVLEPKWSVTVCAVYRVYEARGEAML